ncbi:hypothetical protein MAHJHV65_43680 [Mycobacterium avium subsp. hominissuis]|uniref:hypothetical protein n=1 Tax=Mycobacterium avium TaxID=1764 RepID=UPI0007A036AC|nr:hypothetical protein [Mycobacterium avium]MBZ4508386.1 hypothetical protein [Mycobacterium avium subsp. hominissuis]MCA2295894.1 hypothetical protein [Mycobacterium avium]WOF17897.1 hypothetical protein IHV82_15545 [Mycobacterium avium]
MTDLELDRLAEAFNMGQQVSDDEAAHPARFDPTVRSANGVECGRCDKHRHAPCSRWCWE